MPNFLRNGKFLINFLQKPATAINSNFGLTKKHARFTWTDKHQKAFDEIKQLLVKPPVL